MIAILACNPKSKEQPEGTAQERFADAVRAQLPTDPLLEKYKNQVRPPGYDGLLIYDLLGLAKTPANEFFSLLNAIDSDWEEVKENGELLYQNENSQQFLSRITESELFLVDFSPHHKANYQYLKDNGYFNYDDPDIGNSYFTCDSVFITWRLNENDARGGSGLLFVNID